MNRTRNALIIVGALVVLIVVTVAASRRGGPAAIPVQAKKIAFATFQVKLPEQGTIMHPGTITVPALVAGNLDRIYVKPGDRVVAGQVLATLQNPTIEYTAKGASADYSNAVANVSTARINEQNARVQYQGTVATQKSQLDEARRVYEADLALLDQKAIARTTVDADKAKLDQAKVSYDQAVEQLKLGAVTGYGQSSVQAAQADAQAKQIANAQNQEQVAFLTITAPSGGIIQTVATNATDALRPLQEGDAVSAGQALFTMSQSGEYIVRTQVDEQDIVNVRTGQQVNVSGEDFPGKKLTGTVSQISPVAIKSSDASSTAKQVLTTITLNSSPSFLKDGLTADVDIITTNIPHSLAVPSAALQKDGKKQYVYVIRNGKAAKQFLTTGATNDTETLVLKGLQSGDQVITSKNVTVGVAVSPSPLPTPAGGGDSGATVTIGG